MLMRRDEVTLVVPRVSRRDFVRGAGALALGLAAGDRLFGPVAPVGAQPSARASMQIGWFLNSQMAGDVVGLAKGYFREAGIDLTIRPGGPAIDPIQVVAGGGTMFGNVSSVAVLVNARAQGLPVKAFCTAFQRHPFAFVFFTKSKIRTPKDFEGKTIGIQKYNINKDRLKVLFVGGDTTPLVTGQVDVITGWLINAAQMEAVQQAGAISYFRLWDLGIRLYAYTYFVTDQILRERRDVLVRFVSASARGWLYARDHPDEAIDHLLKMTTGLNRQSELRTWEEVVRGGYLTSVTTKQHGWGYMDPKVWQDLTDTMRALGQIPRPVSVDEIMTDDLVVTAKTPNV